MSRIQPFAEEQACFEKMRHAWLAEGHEGEWVVVLGRRTLGFYESSRDAWKAGIDEWKEPGFMLKQVLLVDRVYVVSQVSLPAPSGGT